MGTLYTPFRKEDVDSERGFQSLPGGPTTRSGKARILIRTSDPQLCSSRATQFLLLDSITWGLVGMHRPLKIGDFWVWRFDETTGDMFNCKRVSLFNGLASE